ncbi:Multiple epidermal growth factor-like domains protein 8, partial [Linnemannia exigua]
MTIVYQKAADSPVQSSFTGFWSTYSPCYVCLDSGRGTCKANTCVCNSKYSGSVCQKESAVYEGFTPRSQHSMAYDSDKDMVYISGGTSARVPWMSDLLTFSFANNKWSNITAPFAPDPRYGHFSFVHKGNLYIYGGIAKYGPIADMWMYDTKALAWSKQPSSNSPSGVAGASYVFFTANSQAQMAAFGGMNKDGVTMRELHFYDVETRRWSRASHQNSVGLSGASAVFHQETNSIYYFGGMINQTIRNTIPYQYSLDQELWFALAPRFDPLASRPAGWNGTMFVPTSSDGIDNNLDDPKGDGSGNSTTTALQNPAMYDAISGVWAPAGLMGSDTVVMYGGMRVHGLGVAMDPSCFIRTMYLYDLSCQTWASYDISDAMGAVRTRVNHTMLLRPGAAGGSKTAYTAYIFGGFDGFEHNDVVNITIDIYPTPPKVVNRCRALNWCNKYDDCQNCNSHYCSYINGLCLFDTDKAKKPVSSSAPILLGETADIPTNGTLQDLLTQRPELKPQVTKTEDSPYIDAPDYDIQFDINSTPNTALVFRTLNVWEGFMNMYWRASNRLLDGTWEDKDGRSTLQPDDLPAIRNASDWDPPVISPSGTLKIAELLRRYNNPVTISVIVNLLNRPVDKGDDKGSQLDLATLGFFMIGFILGVFLLIILGRKLRRVIAERDEAQWAAAEQRMMEEEAAEEERRAAMGSRTNLTLAGGRGRGEGDENYVEKKPMYRIVVGVQQEKEVLLRALTPPGSVPNTLRHRAVRKSEPFPLSRSGSMLHPVSATATTHTGHISSDIVQGEEDISESLPAGRRKSDFIRDLGSSPPTSGGQSRFSGTLPALLQDEPRINEIQRRHTSSEIVRKNASRQNGDAAAATTVASTGGGPLSTLQRGWSLGGRLKASSSLKKRFLDISRVQSEEKEVLTQVSQEAAEDSSAGDVFSGSESDKSLSPLSKDPLLSRRRLRNPIM